MSRRIDGGFFRGVTTLQLSRALLGCVLVHETPEGTVAGVIRETEAYTQHDEASHTFGGKKTKRNEVMFSEAGHLYVYFTYGMHHCMNVVSERAGRGCAVLIRSVTPVEGVHLMLRNRGKDSERGIAEGPGNVCRAFGIDLRHNGTDMAAKESSVYLTEPVRKPFSVRRMPRVGIAKGREKRWRFIAE